MPPDQKFSSQFLPNSSQLYSSSLSLADQERISMALSMFFFLFLDVVPLFVRAFAWTSFNLTASRRQEDGDFLFPRPKSSGGCHLIIYDAPIWVQYT